MYEMNATTRLAASVVRRFTRKVVFIYRAAGKIYHELLFYKESVEIYWYYKGTSHVRYKRRELADAREAGFSSQYGQDLYLVESGLIKDSGGFFVDVGCNHPVDNSNSYYFESRMSFTGIAIDALGWLSDLWWQERSGTRFFHSVVSDAEETVDFVEVLASEGWEHQLSGVAKDFEFIGKNLKIRRTSLTSRPLQYFIDKYIKHVDIDVVFVDVEGHEYKVIKSIKWNRNRPHILVVENTGSFEHKKLVRDYVMAQGYDFRARIWINDDVFVRVR